MMMQIHRELRSIELFDKYSHAYGLTTLENQELVFKAIDGNRDGRINREDLKIMAEKFGYSL
jgi:Ca2+-binding EF-hand superfamily protein